jgi:hypothetical protein
MTELGPKEWPILWTVPKDEVKIWNPDAKVVSIKENAGRYGKALCYEVTWETEVDGFTRGFVTFRTHPSRGDIWLCSSDRQVNFNTYWANSYDWTRVERFDHHEKISLFYVPKK